MSFRELQLALASEVFFQDWMFQTPSEMLLDHSESELREDFAALMTIMANSDPKWMVDAIESKIREIISRSEEKGN